MLLRLERNPGNFPRRVVLPVVAETQTDNRGQYSFSRVDPDWYLLRTRIVGFEDTLAVRYFREGRHIVDLGITVGDIIDDEPYPRLDLRVMYSSRGVEDATGNEELSALGTGLTSLSSRAKGESCRELDLISEPFDNGWSIGSLMSSNIRSLKRIFVNCGMRLRLSANRHTRLRVDDKKEK